VLCIPYGNLLCEDREKFWLVGIGHYPQFTEPEAFCELHRPPPRDFLGFADLLDGFGRRPEYRGQPDVEAMSEVVPWLLLPAARYLHVLRHPSRSLLWR